MPTSSPSSPLSTPPPWLLYAVVVVAIAVRLVGMRADLLDPDAWRQTETATIAHHFLEDPNILYPRVNWGAPGPGYVEAEFQLFTWVVHLSYRVFGEDPIWGRLLSLVVTGLACLSVHRIARRFLDAWPALLATLLFAGAPIVVRYSRVFMPDATALLLGIVAVERTLAWHDSDRARDLISGAAALGAAILVKPTVIVLSPVVAALLIAKGGPRALVRPLVLGCMALAFLPSTAYYAHAASIHAQYGNTFGVISGGDSKWGDLGIWTSGSFYSHLFEIETRWMLGHAGLLLAIVGLFRAPTTLLRVLLGSSFGAIVVYYFAVARYAGFAPRGLHYHLYAVPWVAIAAANGLVVLHGWVSRRFPGRPRAALLACAIAVLAMAVPQARGYLRVVRSDGNAVFLRAGKALGKHSDPEDLVAVTATEVADDNGVPNNFEDPRVLFYAGHRRGVIIATDQLYAANLIRAINDGARWVVTLEMSMASANAGFLGVLGERTDLVEDGDGYKVYRVR